MMIRKRRRDRTRTRLSNQKRLDAIASEKISKRFLDCIETWGASVCPECHKSVPARAFISGGDIRLSDRCIVTVGASVSPQYCHKNRQRCASESAKEDAWKWKESPMFEG